MTAAGIWMAGWPFAAARGDGSDKTQRSASAPRSASPYARRKTGSLERASHVPFVASALRSAVDLTLIRLVRTSFWLLDEVGNEDTWRAGDGGGRWSAGSPAGMARVGQGAEAQLLETGPGGDAVAPGALSPV